MGLLDGIFDKEGMVKATIDDCLQNVAEEQFCKLTEIFIMIKPIADEFSDDVGNDNFKCWIYKMVNGSPKLVRAISLKEILGDD